MTTLNFIKNKLADYYEKHPAKAPDSIEKKEFGFGTEKKIDYRHMAFRNENELNLHLKKDAPLYASFSLAYYNFPAGRPMERKQYLGADLIFEFDEHGDEPNHNAIACDQCLEHAKSDTLRLIEDFLVPDFGFSKNDMRVSFSGNRGYHIYVINDAVKTLNAQARRELVNYIKGDFDFKLLINRKNPNVAGWRKRLQDVALSYMDSRERKEFDTPEKKQYALDQVMKGNFDVIRGYEKALQDQLTAKKAHITAEVDEGVTFDLARLIRLPSTIHGGSSLLCEYVDLNKLGDYRPFRDAVVFGNEPVKLIFKDDVKPFVINEQTFGPFSKGYSCSLPEFAAMILFCRGKADWVND